jgi:hypothetical protein
VLYVLIVEKNTPGVCFVQMEASSQRQAEQLQRGAAINLNHEKFEVLISETPAPRNNTASNRVSESEKGRV